MTRQEAPPLSDGVVVEIEQFVLGALLRGRGLPVIRGFLSEEHFLEDPHRLIYRAMCDAYDQSGATHLPLVRRLVPDHVSEGLQARAGANIDQYLSRLLSEAPFDGSNASLLAKSARNVVEQCGRLRFAERMESVSIAARDPAASVSRLIQTAGNELEEISASLRATKFSRSRMTIGEASETVFRLAEEASRNGGKLTGVTTGLADVDRLTSGFQRKDMVLVGARPSMGKTSLMTSVAMGAAHHGHGIGILSLEMDAAKLTARAVSDLSHMRRKPIQYVDILRGNVQDRDLDTLAEITADMCRLPIEIDEAATGTFDIRMKIEGMMERFERAGWPRLDMLMIDHLGFVQPGANYRGNRNNEIGEITRALKDYAKEYDIALVLLSQLSRDLTKRDNKRPILADLRDSGNIEQDADVVVFLHREAYYLERLEEEGDADIERRDKLDACRNELEFIVAKQRNGPVKTVNLWCDMAYSAVRNAVRYEDRGGR